MKYTVLSSGHRSHDFTGLRAKQMVQWGRVLAPQVWGPELESSHPQTPQRKANEAVNALTPALQDSSRWVPGAY